MSNNVIIIYAIKGGSLKFSLCDIFILKDMNENSIVASYIVNKINGFPEKLKKNDAV